MISIHDYKSYLSSKGRNLSELRKNQSDEIMDATFTGDIGYKRVYILDPDNGWVYTDAKYSRHSKISIAKDAIDYYLQFRPKEHYPLGTYVFIPDDTENELHISNLQDPLAGDNVENLWLIVGRNDATQFVRYEVLKCNWKYRWVTSFTGKKEILSCWGCARNANSYTSGIWNDFYINSLDNLTSAWLPNTHYIFGDKIKDYNLCDTRSLIIQTRTMITLNTINPNCYMVTKVLDMTPKGILKLSLKQDDYNEKRDNTKMLVCDYYSDTGDVVIEEAGSDDGTKTSAIYHMIINDDGELERATDLESKFNMDIGVTYYFQSVFSDDNVDAQWRIYLENDGEYDEDEQNALENLIVLRNANATTTSVRPGKSNRIKGKTFTLEVCDVDGNYKSSIKLGVNK